MAKPGDPVCSAYRQVGDMIVWVTGKEAPTASEWKSYIDLAIPLGKSLKTRSEPLRVLVISDGGAPNSAQRAEFVDASRGLQVRTAVISNSSFVRGVAAVFSWFDVNNKVFAPRDLAGAFAFLRAGRDEQRAMWGMAERLAEEVQGGVITVLSASEYFHAARVSTVA
jgi:hypothetical protein